MSKRNKFKSNDKKHNKVDNCESRDTTWHYEGNHFLRSKIIYMCKLQNHEILADDL